MPQGTTELSAFIRRDTFDHIMFGYVQAYTEFPGISVEKALAQFQKRHKLKEFNIPSQKTRYQRMVREFWDDQRTKVPGTEA